MAETLSTEPLIDPSASLRETRLGAYCEVSARTVLRDVEMGDYSHVVNDSQMSYTTIGKFCTIAARRGSPCLVGLGSRDPRLALPDVRKLAIEAFLDKYEAISLASRPARRSAAS